MESSETVLFSSTVELPGNENFNYAAGRGPNPDYKMNSDACGEGEEKKGGEEGEGEEGGGMGDRCSSCAESLNEGLADRSASLSSLSSFVDCQYSDYELNDDNDQWDEAPSLHPAVPVPPLLPPQGEAQAAGGEQSGSGPGRHRAPQTFDRVALTEPVWHPASLSDIRANHILQNRDTGTFLVHDVDSEVPGRVVVYVAHRAAGVRRYTAEPKPFQGLHILDSNKYFNSLVLLVTYYCDHHDSVVTEPRLVLPAAIREAQSHRDLNSIALLAHQFWFPSATSLQNIAPDAQRSFVHTKHSYATKSQPNIGALSRQSTNLARSPQTLLNEPKPDLATLYRLPGRSKTNAFVQTETEDEDSFLKIGLSDADFFESAGLAPSNWTYRKVSDNSDVLPAPLDSVGCRMDRVEDSTDYENKRLSVSELEDTWSLSASGPTPIVNSASTPRSKDSNVFSFQRERNSSVPNHLNASPSVNGQLRLQCADTVSPSSSGFVLDPTKYQLRTNKAEVASMSSSNVYVFKSSRTAYVDNIEHKTSGVSDARSLTNLILHENVSTDQRKGEMRQLALKKDGPMSTNRGSQKNCTLSVFNPEQNNNNVNANNAAVVFTFNRTQCHDAVTHHEASKPGAVLNNANGLQPLTSDGDFQPSPIYAQPYDALTDKVEHSRTSVKAIRAAMSHLRCPDSQFAPKPTIPVQRSASDRKPKVAGGMSAQNQNLGRVRVTPVLVPLPTGYKIPHDISPSPKLYTASRSQSLWTFAANASQCSVFETAEEAPKTPKLAQLNTGASLSIENRTFVTRSGSIAHSGDHIDGSITRFDDVTGQDAMLDQSFELQFFTPPSTAAPFDPAPSKLPLKFPTTETTAQSKTVDDVIQNLTPQVILRRNESFAMDNSNRISAYDNVSDSRPSSGRRANTESRATEASSGTRYSQPWSNWESMLDAQSDKRLAFAGSANLVVPKMAALASANPPNMQAFAKSDDGLACRILYESELTKLHRSCFESKTATANLSATVQGVNTAAAPNRCPTSTTQKSSRTTLKRLSQTNAASTDARLFGEEDDGLEYSETESDFFPPSEYVGISSAMRLDEGRDGGGPRGVSLQTFSNFGSDAGDRRSGSFDGVTFPQQKSPDVVPLLAGPKLISDKNRGHKLSGARICYYILGLSERPELFFGSMVKNFVSCTLAGKEVNPQIVMQNIRQFMNGMKNYLINRSEKGLEGFITTEQSKMGPNEFLNIDAIMERAMLKCVVKPLHDFVYKLFVQHATHNGSLQLLSDGITLARAKSVSALGISPDLIATHEQAIESARFFLKKMEETYSPLKKLENILGAVSAISDAISKANLNVSLQSTISYEENDLLCILTYVLIQRGLQSAEIEADYTWGLVHPTFLTGDGRQHLATFSSAVNIIKSFRSKAARNSNLFQSMPSSVEGFLQVLCPNEKQDRVSNHLLPVHSSMVTRDICSLMAYRLRLTNPQDYGLYSLINAIEHRLKDDASPQKIHSKSITNFQDCVFVYRRNNATIIWPRNL